MSSSIVKGNVICKCRVHKNISNNDVAKRVAANLLITPYAGRGVTSYDLTLTDDTLYIEALRKDIVGPDDVAYTEVIPKKDVKIFEVTYAGIEEQVTIVAIIRGKEETISCYRENAKEDYIATTMQGLFEPSYTEE